jgi:hypothetical protein
LAAAFGENLDADVMRQHRPRHAALDFIGHVHFPEDGFGVGVVLNHGRLGSEFGGVDRAPFVAAGKRRQERARDKAHYKEAESEKPGEDFHK